MPFQNAGKQANGIVDINRAMTVSSDVFFYNIGLLYWRTWGRGEPAESSTNLDDPQYGIQRAAKLFGFSRQTGIGLPGEARGPHPRPHVQAGGQRRQPRRLHADLAPG